MADNAAANYYEILGLTITATEQEIKNSFNTLAKINHPDIASGSSEKFILISEAYSVLRNPKLRAAYDSKLPKNTAADSQHNESKNFNKTPRSNLSSLVETSYPKQQYLDVSFLDAACGATLLVDVMRPTLCFSCNGAGAPQSSLRDICTGCGGSGILGYSSVGEETVPSVCQKCFGKGLVALPFCGECRGTGYKEKAEKINIKVPAGTSWGDIIKIQNLGGFGNSKIPGPLLYIVRVAPHQFFTRDGLNIKLTVPITLGEAASGAVFKIPTIYGESDLVIPPNTSSGTVFRLVDLGIRPPDTPIPGSMFVIVMITLPQSLDNKAVKKLQDFDKFYTIPVRQNIWA